MTERPKSTSLSEKLVEVGMTRESAKEITGLASGRRMPWMSLTRLSGPIHVH